MKRTRRHTAHICDRQMKRNKRIGWSAVILNEIGRAVGGGGGDTRVAAETRWDGKK